MGLIGAALRIGRLPDALARLVAEGRPLTTYDSSAPAFYAAYPIMMLVCLGSALLTISVFDTQEGAEGSTPLGFKWVQENLGGYIQGNPEATVGWVFAGASVPASR